MGSCCAGDHSDEGRSALIDDSLANYNSNKIGLAAGGAKDVNNFRECIENDILPPDGSITYNGVLYEYYFDISTKKQTTEFKQDVQNDLFYPTYCYAKTKQLKIFDIDTKTENETDTTDTKCDECEYFLSVGLNSNIKQTEFKRKHLNLVIALDVSGSMGFVFDKNKPIDINIYENDLCQWCKTLKTGDIAGYVHKEKWYIVQIEDVDQDKNELKIHFVNRNKRHDKYVVRDHKYFVPATAINTKLKLAKDAIMSLYKHLTSDDRIAVITFSKSAQIVQNLEFVDRIEIDTLKDNILAIQSVGGTNLEDAYNVANNLYEQLISGVNEKKVDEKIDEKADEYEQLNKINMTDYDNRIIFFTDAEINTGEVSVDKLLSMVNEYANGDNKIYSTFIGIGLDFNSKLVEQLSNTRGCNYYYVKTIYDFMNTMNKQEFEYMVTPLVFNVCLRLICEGDSCVIDKVFGTTDEMGNNIKENGEIINIHTLFPSTRRVKADDKSKKETKGGIQLIKLKKLSNNDCINCELEITFEDRNGKVYTNKQFITFESNNNNNDNFYDNNGIRKGILLCKYVELMSKWIKHQSNNNIMDKQYKKCIKMFLNHFKKEMNELNDDTLEKEVKIMQKIIDADKLKLFNSGLL